MINILKFSPAFLLLIVLSMACNKEPNSGTNEVSVATLQTFAESNQALGWKLFQEVQLTNPDQNVLISPFSIQTALLMTGNGAQGGTLTELLDVLAWNNNSIGQANALHRDLASLLSGQSGQPELTIANRFFFDEGRMSVKPAFQDSLYAYYQAGSQHVDFNNEQAALNQINDWVNINTKGKIAEILDDITPYDVAFLINALHFKADWASGFNPDQSFEGPFILANGNSLPVHYVHADRNFTFAQTADFNMVDIPFQDSTFSFTLIQAGSANTNADWRLTITPEVWRNLYGQAQYGRAMVSFPRLRLSFKDDLVKSLQNLGMEQAFSETQADFSAMGSAGNRIFIKQIAHKAVLEVDERGAEGAAVTSIGFAQTSVPPAFQFNKPFVLVLRHVPTQTILFLGYVVAPQG